MRNIRKFETFEDFLASQESVSGSGKYVQDIVPGFVYVKERYEDGTYALESVLFSVHSFNGRKGRSRRCSYRALAGWECAYHGIRVNNHGNAGSAGNGIRT